MATYVAEGRSRANTALPAACSNEHNIERRSGVHTESHYRQFMASRPDALRTYNSIFEEHHLDALLLPPPSADGPALVTLPVATGRALRRRRKPAASTASARSLGLRMCTGPRGSRRRLIPLAPITESAPPGAGARDDDETQGSLSDSSSDSVSYCA